MCLLAALATRLPSSVFVTHSASSDKSLTGHTGSIVIMGSLAY